ncbi:single-strand DNA-binding protein [Nocardia transvalensis]|uniref:Single-strand DNA-binding protein n=1 Tax=Nocardia transvalensis TaxID=37333 RepID=A0A7W9PMS7_9NOCA|nr:single-stranded DNA-binding protein [Nocardia transvalensis]MBB5918820.1 single-strand DNA-binding protein [Nocardia transvalensis]
MYEANTAVIGTVVTHPVRRSLPGGEQVVSFRMASNARRFDRDRGWVDNGALFLTVDCRRRTAEGADSSIRRGDPIIAYGRLRTAEYRTEDGVERHDLEMRAGALGPDLGRCSTPVRRRAGRNSADAPSVDDEAVRGPGASDMSVPVGATPADAG